MLETSAFGDELRKLGYDFFSGVPCSFLKDLINYAINEVEYFGAANEGDAVAIATGARLGGKKSVVLMQNSGLTNATSPLTSLNAIFKIPVLGFVSLRGEEGVPDEPQHDLMGKITTDMLTSMKVRWEFLESDIEKAKKQLAVADACLSDRQTFFFVVKKDTFGKTPLKSQKRKFTESPRLIQNVAKTNSNGSENLPTRWESLQKIVDLENKNTFLLATTGFTGRELYEVKDLPQHFYMVGSMGCISSLALGFAYAQPHKEVIAIDGDGSLLMRMGALATCGHYAPKNLLHILLDNNAHDSTGGQLTVSHNVNFAEAAHACGYPLSKTANGLEELSQCIQDWQKKPELTFIQMRTKAGAKEGLGRPKIKPYEVADRLQAYLAENSK